MSRHSPTLPTAAVAAVAVLCATGLVYAVLALGNPLLGLLPILAAVAVYVAWRFLLAVEAMADGLQRLADAREREES